MMRNKVALNALWQAIEHCNALKVRELLNTDIDINQPYPYLFGKKITFIYKAVIRALYGSGKDSSVQQNKIQILELILQKGANPNTKQDGFSILNYATYLNPNIMVINLLLKYGADPNLQNDQRNTPLHYIGNTIQKARTSLLPVSPIARIPMVSRSSASDITAWMHCLKLLLLWGADPTIKNGAGQSFIEVFPMIKTMQSELRHTASRYNLITSEKQADFAALRAFLELPGKERRSWITLSSGLAKARSLPQELVDHINSWAFTPALGKYRFSLEDWKAFGNISPTDENNPVTLKFT